MHKPIMALMLGLIASTLAQSKEIVIASINEQTPRLIVSTSIIRQIYQRLGYEMTVVNYPAKRSLLEVNNGSANGELARANIIEADNPNLIRIPYAIGIVKAVVAQKRTDSPIQKLADLKDHRIGILRGFVVAEQMTENVTREVYSDLPALFKGLIYDRVDAILFLKIDLEYYIRKHKLENSLKISNTPFLEIPIYHYLHKNSANIAKALQTEIKKMHTSGELQDLIKAEENNFIEGARIKAQDKKS